MTNKDFIDQIKSKGVKLNTSRMHFLELFLGNHKSYSALELVDLLKSNMDRATVYRNINFFLKTDILKQIQLQGEQPKFELKILDHHHHLICKHCNKIFSIQSKSLEDALQRVTEEVTDFTITDHVFEFYGICKECMKDEE